MFSGMSKDGKPVYIYKFVDYEDVRFLWSFNKVSEYEIQEVLDRCNKDLFEYRERGKRKMDWCDTHNEDYISGKSTFPEKELKYPEWEKYLKKAFGMQRFKMKFTNNIPHGHITKEESNES